MIDPVTVSPKNENIDFGVCVREILRGHMTQGLLIKESTEVNMTRKNGSQATGEFNFYVDGINKWGNNEADIACATR